MHHPDEEALQLHTSSEAVDRPAPLREPLACPTCQGHGEHKVVVVAFPPCLVRVVGGGDVDIYFEVEELFAKRLCERHRFGYLELSILHQDERSGGEITLGHAEASAFRLRYRIAAGDRYP